MFIWGTDSEFCFHQAQTEPPKEPKNKIAALHPVAQAARAFSISTDEQFRQDGWFAQVGFPALHGTSYQLLSFPCSRLLGRSALSGFKSQLGYFLTVILRDHKVSEVQCSHV